MPTMVTFQAGRIALVTAVVGLAAACSGEQQDWRSAQSADSSEAWGRFIEQHPDSELAGQARARIAQLDEQRDWQHADSVATMEAYRSFLARHPAGRWSEEARIRIEGFSLGSAPRSALPTPEEAAAIDAAARVHAFHLATASVPAAVPAAAVQPTPDAAIAVPVAADAAGPAVPGEAATPAPTDAPQPTPAEVTEPPPLPSAAEPAAGPGDAATPAANGYGVQLGAFGSQASADREWQRLRGRFGSELAGLSPRIVVASSDSGQLYRLQAPAAGEAQARAICASLQEQSQPCVPVVPR
jgi:cell division septation protein DedD